MQTGRIVQAVALVIIVAVATSCSASKEYSSKLFAPRTTVIKDSQAVAIRFLELDAVEPGKESWVTTDIIMGRDTGSQTAALDNLAKVFPASSVSKDPATTTEVKTMIAGKPDSSRTDGMTTTVAKPVNTQKTKDAEVKSETKSDMIESEPVARNIKTGEVREKRSRNE